jgi:hypothetical protein
MIHGLFYLILNIVLSLHPLFFDAWLLLVSFLVVQRAYSQWKDVVRRVHTPTSKIRAAAQGEVEIVGYPVPLNNKNIISPIFRHPCVRVTSWVTANVPVQKRTGDKVMEWRHEEKSEEVPFALKDATGIVFIMPMIDLEIGTFIRANKAYLAFKEKQTGALDSFVPDDAQLLDLWERIIATTRPLIGRGFLITVNKGVDILALVEKQTAAAVVLDDELRSKISGQWKLFSANNDNSVNGNGERFHVLLPPQGALMIILGDRVKDFKKDFIETNLSFTLAPLLLALAYFYFRYFW